MKTIAIVSQKGGVGKITLADRHSPGRADQTALRAAQKHQLNWIA
jgi:MinD superfamily P-loop ATPase